MCHVHVRRGQFVGLLRGGESEEHFVFTGTSLHRKYHRGSDFRVSVAMRETYIGATM